MKRRLSVAYIVMFLAATVIAVHAVITNRPYIAVTYAVVAALIAVSWLLRMSAENNRGVVDE